MLASMKTAAVAYIAITTRLEPEVYEELRETSAVERRSMTAIINDALRGYFTTGTTQRGSQ